jgi:hypothetical protein
MAWTTPRTWTNGEVVTKTIQDTHIRDNLNWLFNGHRGVEVTASSFTMPASGVTAEVSAFDGETHDDWSGHAGSNAYITVPETARYFVAAELFLSGQSGSGANGVGIRLADSGGTPIVDRGFAWAPLINVPVGCATVMSATANQQFRVVVYHTASGTSGTASVRFSVYQVRSS